MRQSEAILKMAAVLIAGIALVAFAGLGAVAEDGTSEALQALGDDESDEVVYYFWIQMLIRADEVESEYYSQEDLEEGFWISGTGENACEALRAATAEYDIPFDCEDSGWINQMFGFGDVATDDGGWETWAQYKYDEDLGYYTYNQSTLAGYTEGGYFKLLYGTTYLGAEISGAPDSEIYVGDTVQLTAYLTPDQIVASYPVWESSDESVATVSEDGLLTAVGPGTAEITLTVEDDYYSGSTDTVTVTVLAHAESVALDQETGAVEVGGTLQLTATVSPEEASDQSVTWSSSDESVATVDSDGLVTGVSEGTATITATTVDGGYTAACEVTVAAVVYTVTYLDGEDSSYEATETVEDGGTASGPTSLPSRDGYCLLGWSDADGNAVDLSTYVVEADVTLYALYGEHDYVATETVDATCDEDGYTTYVCSVCGDTYTEEIAATGHSYVYADGYYTCSVCGDSYAAEDSDSDDTSSDTSDDTSSDTSGDDSEDDDSGTIVMVAVVIIVVVIVALCAVFWYRRR